MVGNPLSLIVLVVGAIVVGAIVLFLGLCVASLFLPVILVIIGLILVMRGMGGNQIPLAIGLLLIIIGVLLWYWS